MRNSTRFFHLALTFGVVLCLGKPACAASDYLLELDGISGESDDTTHPGAIDVVAFSHDISNTGGGRKGHGGGGGGGGGKASFSDFSLAKRIDKATPLLAKACASGTHIKEAKITCRKAGGGREEYLKYKMSDCIISSYSASGGGSSSSGSPNDLPLESLSFSYAKIEWTYTVFVGGVPTETIVGGWDLKMNKGI
jgi:type VI secretion system secreted protein Hcp